MKELFAMRYRSGILSAFQRAYLRATTRADQPPARRRASRAQALVEFALFAPLLLMLVVGATDIASLLNDHLNIVYATRTAVRVGATLGTAPNADCAMIGALQAALSNDHNLIITRITIYKSDGLGNPITANEDVYPGNAICTPGATISPGATALNWPPGQRANTAFVEDSIGILVNYSYLYQLNLLGLPALNAADHAVMPLEVVIGAPIPPSGVGK